MPLNRLFKSYTDMANDERITLVEHVRLSRITPKKTSKVAKKKKKQAVAKKEKAQTNLLKAAKNMTPEMIKELMEALE